MKSKIIVKATILPIYAVREITLRMRLMRCRCWHRDLGRHRIRFDYFPRTENRYYMRNSHGKEEEQFDY